MSYQQTFIIVGLLLISTTLVVGLVMDSDGDGIPSYRELSEGSNPLSAISDSDDLPDNVEYKLGSDPALADTDGDGLLDGIEREFGSDPTLADTDNDGLDDEAEYNGGRVSGDATENLKNAVSWSRSDPRSPHSDPDRIPDRKEAKLGIDPTAEDSDGDGLSDQREVEKPTDPRNPDTDGDNLLDGWEAKGETDKGASLPGADPLHKDMYVQVMYLRGTNNRISSGVLSRVETWYARMPVKNPDGEAGINVHLYANDKYSGPVNQSIDPWSNESGVKAFMMMRKFYNRKYMGPRVGSYFLIVVPGDFVRTSHTAAAIGSKTSYVHPYSISFKNDTKTAHTITHETLHNIVGEVRPGVNPDQCNGSKHTCNGYLSYNNDFYLSEKSATKLNKEGFADPVYPEQMNATSCEDTTADPSNCAG